MITNITAFPSSLTMILVPDGDVKSVRQDFVVNENLKRLGCSGRVGLTFSKANAAAKNKFYQLYRTNSEIAFNDSVVQLVKLCQIALMLFDKLAAEYVDGLLCDMTETAINDWWIEFGTEYYNVEPHDGILGPTTVAALLGMLTGARNRLHAYGAPVSKDVFDIETTKKAIAYFQKAQHLKKTRRLDRQTLTRLHRATAKAASNEGGWLVPRSVKSAVADVSGKGGEMVRDIVGRSDKTSSKIGDVETTDIEGFVDQIHGSTSKWLWQGKKRKGSIDLDMFGKASGTGTEMDMVFQDDQHGGFEWSRTRKGPFLEPSPDFGDEEHEKYKPRRSFESEDREREPNKLQKRPTRTSSHRAPGTHDGSRGLGRIKDAVGLRSHHSKITKEEQRSRQASNESNIQDSSPLPHNTDQYDAVAGTPSLLKSEVVNDGLYRNTTFSRMMTDDHGPTDSQQKRANLTHRDSDDGLENNGVSFNAPFSDSQPRSVASGTASRSRSPNASRAASKVDLSNAGDEENTAAEPQNGSKLKRTQSFTKYSNIKYSAPPSQSRFPRRISFSLAEESLLTWTPLISETTTSPKAILESDDIEKHHAFLHELFASKIQALATSDHLTTIEKQIGDWLSTQLASLTTLDADLEATTTHLSTLSLPHNTNFSQIHTSSQNMIRDERDGLDSGLREIELLNSKLEYEINVLRSRVEDVEEGVDEFEKQVGAVEDRVKEIEILLRPKEGWFSWAVRLFMGAGKKPDASTRRNSEAARIRRRDVRF